MSLNEHLLKKICAVLTTDHPDITFLHNTIQQELNTSSEQAQNFIYNLILKLNLAIFPPLTQLELILTERCNLACKYCFEKQMTRTQDMSARTAQASIDLLFDYSLNEPKLEVVYFGGEPLLNFALIKYTTEYAEKKAKTLDKSIRFNITTNGTLITEPIANYCANHNINVLLSIDGLESTHNRFRVYRSGQGTFEQIIKNMRILKKEQPWIGTKITVMPENAPNLLEDILGLYNMGVNQFVIGHASGIKWSNKDMKAYKLQLDKIIHWYEQNSHQDFKISEFEINNRMPPFFGCQAGRSCISISTNGEISPCSKILSLDNKNLISKLGDITYGLANLRKRAELVSCLKLQSKCNDLGIAKDFRGGCFAENYEDNGDLFQPSIQEYHLSLIKSTLASYGKAKN